MSVTTSPAPAEPRLALVLGATGAFGSHAVAALLKHGWRIRALARDPDAARRKSGPAMPIEWVRGDALDRASVRRRGEGARPDRPRRESARLPQLEGDGPADGRRLDRGGQSGRRAAARPRVRLQLRPQRRRRPRRGRAAAAGHPKGEDPRRDGGAPAGRLGARRAGPRRARRRLLRCGRRQQRPRLAGPAVQRSADRPCSAPGRRTYSAGVRLSARPGRDGRRPDGSRRRAGRLRGVPLPGRRPHPGPAPGGSAARERRTRGCRPFPSPGRWSG